MHARVVTLLLLAGGCTRHAAVERPPPEAHVAAPSAPVAVADAGEEREADAEAALAGFPEIVELRDGAELLGVVSVPLGAREPRPVMVALHGGSDRPERACPAWRIAADAYAFIVCPRGWGGNGARLGWRSAADSKARIGRAVAAAKKLFGPWVKDTSTVVLAGFSMGASAVARVAEGDPRTYRRIVIGDSAHDPRPALGFSRVWVAGGGERALFMCTTSGCEPTMRAAAKRVAAHEGVARLVIAPTQVHALSARSAGSLRRDWAWLVAGAEGWEAYLPPAEPDPGGRTEVFEQGR